MSGATNREYPLTRELPIQKGFVMYNTNEVLFALPSSLMKTMAFVNSKAGS